MHLESEVTLALGICLVSAFLLNLVSRKLRLPLMIAPLIIGIGINVFQNSIPFYTTLAEIVSIFADFGVIVVLFFIGLGIDFRFIKDLSKNSSIMALNAGHMPFFAGFFLTYLVTRNWIEALFVGIAIAITAEEVSVTILEELGLLRKRVGQLIIEAGIIGDIFEIMAITILGLFLKTFTGEKSSSVLMILLELFIFILVILVMRYFVIEWLLKLTGEKGKKFEYFGVAFFVLLVMSMASELLNFSVIIGALLAGLLLKDKLIQDKLYYEEHHIMEAIEVFNFGVFHPLIFVWIGLTINLSLIMINLWFGILLTLVATLSKIAGSMIGNYFCGQPLSEGILIGWGLNARGATELFAVLIAKNQGIISQNIYSAIVFMALVTTIISPIVFKILVLKGYGMMDHKVHKRNGQPI